jgi:hypothetical protein
MTLRVRLRKRPRRECGTSLELSTLNVTTTGGHFRDVGPIQMDPFLEATAFPVADLSVAQEAALEDSTDHMAGTTSDRKCLPGV